MKQIGHIGRRPTQSERRALSDKRMMAAALKLIARQGSSRTTLAEIGEAAGYTYGLVSKRFGSKSALVQAVTRVVQSTFVQRILPEQEDLTGIDALKAVIDSYLNRVDSVGRRALYVLIGEALGPVPEIRPDISRADEGFRRNLRLHLEQGIASGEVRSDVDPASQAALLLATLRGVSLQALINPEAIDLKQMSNDLQDNLERTLLRRASRSSRDERIAPTARNGK